MKGNPKKETPNAKSSMPCGIIPSGRAPKSIVVSLTCIDLPIRKGWQNRRFFNVLPKRAHLKNERVCSCTTTVYVNLSMNSFILLTGNFVPESGCKITHFFIPRKTTRKKIFILIYYLTFVNALRI